MLTGLTLALALAAGQAPGSAADHAGHARDAALGLIELQTYMALPREHQRLIIGRIEAGALDPEVLATLPDWMQAQQTPEFQRGLLHDGEPGDYIQVAHLISREAFEAMPVAHQRALVGVNQARIDAGQPIAAMCFAPGTPVEVVDAFNLASTGGPDFNTTTRWSTTASGSFPGQGTPVLLTWSVVPDGTFVPNAVGLGYSGPSNLRAFLNGIYGNEAIWMQIYQDMFDRWAELGGLSFIYEPADDGSNLNVSGNGSLGLRGDLRMAGIPLDGNSGVWPKQLPPDGDMVLDTADNFYFNTTNNSRAAHILAHERGHGQGILRLPRQPSSWSRSSRPRKTDPSSTTCSPPSATTATATSTTTPPPPQPTSDHSPSGSPSSAT